MSLLLLLQKIGIALPQNRVIETGEIRITEDGEVRTVE